MKKILLALLCVFFMTSCSASNEKTTRLKLTGVKEISYKNLKAAMNKKVSFILYIGRPDCGDCMAFEPILKSYLKNHKNEGVYYLNIKAYRDAANKKNASSEEKSFYKNLSKTFKFDWTPTLEVITNGKIGKQYTYLDEDYYEIKDRAKQIKKQKKFVAEFKTFMKNYYSVS
jgi:predicted bacteriocin transport accessory protein